MRDIYIVLVEICEICEAYQSSRWYVIKYNQSYSWSNHVIRPLEKCYILIMVLESSTALEKEITRPIIIITWIYRISSLGVFLKGWNYDWYFCNIRWPRTIFMEVWTPFWHHPLNPAETSSFGKYSSRFMKEVKSQLIHLYAELHPPSFSLHPYGKKL